MALRDPEVLLRFQNLQALGNTLTKSRGPESDSLEAMRDCLVDYLVECKSFDSTDEYRVYCSQYNYAFFPPKPRSTRHKDAGARVDPATLPKNYTGHPMRKHISDFNWQILQLVGFMLLLKQQLDGVTYWFNNYVFHRDGWSCQPNEKFRAISQEIRDFSFCLHDGGFLVLLDDTVAKLKKEGDLLVTQQFTTRADLLKKTHETMETLAGEFRTHGLRFATQFVNLDSQLCDFFRDTYKFWDNEYVYRSPFVSYSDDQAQLAAEAAAADSQDG